ncbi:signal peptide peptidase-like 2A isoform X2 [Callorhinchus milii]|uniref:signal peptide peptidase-like 2A isoform X2 n=1 Tax=Callorhinchus milii TaxID=7868 RepID=UPI001C3FF081|nr:signal peptide peptidase-like 2A isoform X2 [Callorhinchus milii]
MARSVLTAAAFALLLLALQADAQEGILQAYSNETAGLSKDFCILYNPNWVALPSSLGNATVHRLQILTSTMLCKVTDVPSEGLQGIVVVMRGNCTLTSKAKIAQNHGAKALLIASIENPIPPRGNASESKEINIPVALLQYNDVVNMKKVLGNSISGVLYSPPVPSLDYSILLIFVIAVATVTVGGYWSGSEESGRNKNGGTASDSRRQTKELDRNKDQTLILSPLTVVVFVAICCVMIVLLYFFYKWLVYVVIAIFCLASAISLYNCLSAVMAKIPFCKCRLACGQRSFEVRLIFLAAVCVAIAVVWVVFRNDDSWVWILHDFLGVAFCLNFLKTVKLPHFKSCVILLGLLLLYDVFFVFITPFITPQGKSIMVEVATGGTDTAEKSDGMGLIPEWWDKPNGSSVEPSSYSHHEKLPVVLRVPRLTPSVITLCGMSFSLLGFGDIIVPGLLVAYCRRFDVQRNSSNIYFVSCAIAYAVGLILTFVVLILTKMAQPALLYLVPCTLLASVVTAWTRKEMRTFWSGHSYEMMNPGGILNPENSEGVSEQPSEHP